MFFVDYLQRSLSVAYYLPPGVVHSDDSSKLITVSRFAPGAAPEKALGNEWTWIFYRDLVLT